MVASLALLAASAALPNIVLVLSDDSGYGDFSCYGSTVIPTPNIDAVARAGVRFTQGYVSGAVCSPSRAGLLTGRYQQRFGHEYNLPEPGSREPGDTPEFMGLPVEQKTVADRLKALGYATGVIGKWHLGEEDRFYPTRRGFDEFYGFRAGSRGYFDRENAARPLESNVREPRPFAYLTDHLAEVAADFVRRHHEAPFFLYVAFNATHTPMHALPEDEAAFPYLSGRRRTQAAMIRALDRGVGTIDAALREAGVANNTLFVFLNDNGGTPPTNASLNAPLNGMKGSYLEGGIRVPFILRWPGRVAAGGTYEPPVISLDLMPTFVAAAGGPPVADKETDGVDLLPFLDGRKAGRPHDVLYWRLGYEGAIRDGDWKLVRVSDRPAMLFDLSKDVGEQNDLADEHPDRVRSMLKKMFAWETTLIHPVFRTAPSWIKSKVDLYDRKYELTQPPPPPAQAGARKNRR